MATNNMANLHYAWASCPTPPKTDSSTKIATTQWVANHRCTTKATTTSSASVNSPCYVIENYKDGTNWWRIWSDGWVEQGGKTGNLPSNAVTTVTLLKALTTTDYNVQLAPHYFGGTSDGWNENQWVTSVATNNFGIYNSAAVYGGVYWYACGY